MLLKQISSVSAVTLAGLIMTTVLGVFLARLMGPSAYGEYAWVVSLCTLVALPILGGLPSLIVREVSAKRVAMDQAGINGVVIFGHRVVFFGYIVIFVTLGSVASYTSLFDFDTAILGLALLHILFMGYEAFYSSVLRGFSLVSLAIMPKNLLRPCILIVSLIVCDFFGVDFSSKMVLMLNAGVLLFVVLCMRLMYLYRVHPHLQSNTFNLESRGWLLSLLPLTLYGAMSIANGQVVVVILGFFDETETVGLYRVAISIAGLVGVSLSIVNMVLAPRFSANFQKNDYQQINSDIRLGGGAALLGCCFVTVLFFAWGKWGISVVFGEEYNGVFALLVVLLFGELINVASGSPALLLNMSGNEVSTAKIMILAIVVTLALTVFLVPSFGGLGAAYAYSTSLIFWNIALGVVVYRKIGIISSPILNWLASK